MALSLSSLRCLRVALVCTAITGCGEVVPFDAETGSTSGAESTDEEAVEVCIEPDTAFEPHGSGASCDAHLTRDDERDDAFIVRFVNETDEPIAVLDTTWACGAPPRHFTAEGTLGSHRFATLAQTSCDRADPHWCSVYGSELTVCRDCIDVRPPLVVAPWGFVEEPWGDFVAAEVPTRAECFEPPNFEVLPTCMALATPDPPALVGFEFVAEAGPASDCNPRCTCNEEPGFCEFGNPEPSLRASTIWDGCGVVELVFRES